MSHPDRRSERLFSDIFLPEETRAIRAEVRAFAERVLRPRAHALNTVPERRDGFPRELFLAHLERERAAFCAATRSADFREGVSAFLQRRVPVFSGR